MTPEEAIHHEWLQPSSSSSTFVLSSSTSATSLLKHNRSDQLKENDQSQIVQKFQRSQPITPLTILPQIKTPSNHRNQIKTTVAKDGSRIKGLFVTNVKFSIWNNILYLVLGSSTTDLEVTSQKQCSYYPQQQQSNIRKLSTTINNNNNTMQHSTISNTSSSSSSSINSSGKYGMSHSQSTGDVSATIFGKAWHVHTLDRRKTKELHKSVKYANKWLRECDKVFIDRFSSSNLQKEKRNNFWRNQLKL